MNAMVQVEPVSPVPASPPLGTRTRRFTLDDVFAMQAMGVIGGDERLELIDGELVPMQSKFNRHFVYQARLVRWFGRKLPDSVEVGAEPTLFLDPFNGPQPDVQLHPAGIDTRDLRPSQVYLVIEVSDSTVAEDLGPKALLYARFGVPEYWVVDAPARVIHVHRGPLPDGWREVRRYAADEAVAPLAFPDLAVSLTTLAPEFS